MSYYSMNESLQKQLLKLQDYSHFSQLNENNFFNYVTDLYPDQCELNNLLNKKEFQKLGNKKSLTQFQQIENQLNQQDINLKSKNNAQVLIVKQKRKYRKRNNKINNIFLKYQQAQTYVQHLQKLVCLRTTPIQQIKNYIKQDRYFQKYEIDKYDLSPLYKVIEKRKRILKRQKAKQRYQNSQYIYKQQSFNSHNFEFSKNTQSFDLVHQEKKIIPQLRKQDKKKRNRISAQVSRDRRKMYIVQLQKNNSKLKQQYNSIQKENERLKKQIQQFRKLTENKNEQVKIKSQEQSTPFYQKQANQPINLRYHNKFSKMMVFLGVIFFITLLKNTILNNQKFKSFKILDEKQQMDMQIQRLINTKLLINNQELILYPRQQQKNIFQKTIQRVKQHSFYFEYDQQKDYNFQQGFKSKMQQNECNLIGKIIQKIPLLQNSILMPKDLYEKIKSLSQIFA